jgi:O-antigen/teichoic acid export membrane protein
VAGAGLRSNAVWALAGQGAAALAQWVVVVVLARTGDLELVGTYGLALAICTPVFAFWALGLRNVYVGGRHTDGGLGPFIRLRSTTMVAALVCTAVIALMLEPAGASVLLLVAAGRAADMVGDILFAYDHARSALRPVALFQLANSLLSTLAVLAILLSGGNLVMALAASLGVSVVLSIALPARRVARLCSAGPPSSASKGHGWRLWRSAVPLGLASLVTAAGMNVPRYALELHSGRADVGILSALSYIMLATTLVAAATAQSLLPELARRLADGGGGALVAVVRAGVVRALAAGAALVAAGFLAGRQVLGLVYGPLYAAHWITFGVLCLAAALIAAGWILDMALVALGAFRHQLIATVAALGLTAALTGPLVWLFGLLGAALATVVFAGTLCIARALTFGHVVRASRRSSGPAQPTG